MESELEGTDIAPSESYIHTNNNKLGKPILHLPIG